MSSSLNECLYNCVGLSTEHGIFQKSPYQQCVNACKKGSKHDTGYGDPDEIFDVGLNLDASLDANFGTTGPSFGGNGSTSNGETVDDPMGDMRVLYGVLAVAIGLIFIGMR